VLGAIGGTAASLCKACPAGQIESPSGDESCMFCPDGKYQGSAGQASCTGCAAGMFTGPNDLKVSCRQCAAGRHMDELAVRHANLALLASTCRRRGNQGRVFHARQACLRMKRRW
jgi:hypothetical protein